MDADDIVNEYIVKRDAQLAHDSGRGILALSKKDNKKVRIRSFRKAEIMDAVTQRQIQREIDACFGLNHPGIVHFYDFFEDASSYYLVTENCKGGSIVSWLYQKRKFKEKEAAIIFYQIVLALIYCHERSVFHRSISLGNILVTQFPNIKIDNFSSCVFSHGAIGTKYKSDFTSPESMRKEVYNAAKSDIWSLGVCLYMMVTGTSPWVADPQIRIGDAILEGQYSIPEWVSEPCRDLIRSMMNPKPILRASLGDIMDCAWIRLGVPTVPTIARQMKEAVGPPFHVLIEREAIEPPEQLDQRGEPIPIPREIVSPLRVPSKMVDVIKQNSIHVERSRTVLQPVTKSSRHFVLSGVRGSTKGYMSTQISGLSKLDRWRRI
jgi:serine/threonine protein kinase